MTYQNKLRAGGEFYLRGKFQQLIGEEFHVLISKIKTALMNLIKCGLYWLKMMVAIIASDRLSDMQLIKLLSTLKSTTIPS